jgi:hypothetical protein
MNSIARLNCRIRVRGTSEAAHTLGTRLQSDIKQRVSEAYSAALEQAFAGDPSVYVMRNLNLRLQMPLFRQDPSKFVQQVADNMARAAQRSALTSEDTIRFENQADYTAHFLADLLHSRAWDSWFYVPFRELRSLPLLQLIARVLLEDPAILKEILMRLQDMDQLDHLLNVLPQAIQVEVWEQLYQPGRKSSEPLPDAWRPFYAAARDLLQRLGMSPNELPDLETLLRRMPDYFSAAPDWRDPQALASAVMEMILLLARHRDVHQELLLNEQRALLSLNTALLPLDWLDQEYLRQELLNWLTAPVQTPDSQAFASRPAVVTPRQAQCLEDLLAALQARRIDLNSHQPASAENAIRLLATLTASASRWLEESLPSHLIAILLAAWETLMRSSEPVYALQALRQSDLEQALKLIPQFHRDQARAAFAELLKLGSTAINILEILGGKESSAAQSVSTVSTRCAGIALLLRAVRDVRLPYLLKNHAFPDPTLSPEHRLQAVLLRCFEDWAGAEEQANTGGLPQTPYDPGFLLLAGADANFVNTARSPTFSLSDLASFQAIWHEQLAGLHMDPTGDLAEDLLRLWARWLRGFAESSVPFLLENFIRRPGSIFTSPTEITVVMPPRPLDLVIEMAGYLAPIENVSWLGGRRLSFTIASDESLRD